MQGFFSSLINWGYKSYKDVSIYEDNANTLLLIPCGRAKKQRVTVEIDNIIRLDYPYSVNDLATKIVEALELCYSEEPEEIPQPTAIEKYLNVKGWKKATADKKCVTLSWKSRDGYSIQPSAKDSKSGCYIPISETGNQLEKKARPLEIAEAVIAALAISTK